jgi:hypothetical protein
MKLLFVPAREAVPSTRDVVSAWAIGLPVVRPVTRTRRWLKGAAD